MMLSSLNFAGLLFCRFVVGLGFVLCMDYVGLAFTDLLCGFGLLVLDVWGTCDLCSLGYCWCYLEFCCLTLSLLFMFLTRTRFCDFS